MVDKLGSLSDNITCVAVRIVGLIVVAYEQMSMPFQEIVDFGFRFTRRPVSTPYKTYD